MIIYPDTLNPIFDKLLKHSIKPIIVGGFVRDTLLGIECKDIDVELYGITSLDRLQSLLAEFGKINNVGKSFGISKLKYSGYELDFSLPRIDNKINSGHRGFEIKINSGLDFKTAASRRDFTINSMGYDIIEKKILDPFNAINDLEKKILRATDKNSFTEDPLRVLRAIRFCSIYDFKPDEELFNLCKNMIKNRLLDELPKERIFEEIKKIVLKSKKPSVAFEMLQRLKSDIFTGEYLAIDNIANENITNKKTKLVLCLAVLCYGYMGKYEDFILKLTNEKELLTSVMKLLTNKDSLYDSISDYKLYKLATIVNLEELLIFTKAINKLKQNSYDKIYIRAKELNILNKSLPPLLKGSDLVKLGLKPSPKFSTILDDAYDAQISSKFSNYDDAILWLKSYLKL